MLSALGQLCKGTSATEKHSLEAQGPSSSEQRGPAARSAVAPPAAARRPEAPVFRGMARNVRVIGVGGCTRAGKTSLTRHLAGALQAAGHAVAHVCLDAFFVRPAMVAVPCGETFPDFESPGALQWQAFAQHIDEAVAGLAGEEEAFVVIEGFLLYHFEAVMARCDIGFYLELDRDACRHRRMTTKPVPDEYFDELLWPSFLRYGQPPGGAVLLDGSLPQATLHARALGLLCGRFPSFVPPRLSGDASALEDACEEVVLSTSSGRRLPVPPRALWSRPGAAAADDNDHNDGDDLPAVLILSGAFNPPHRMHTECLALARRHLEGQGIKVDLAYMAPSSDSYIRGKVAEAGERPEFAMSLTERCRLCELAVQESSCGDWVRVLPWGIASGPNIQSSVQATLASCGYRARCLTVYGADFFIKYGTLPPDNVCISRAGYEEELRLLIEATKSMLGGLPEGTFITTEKLETVSSTTVRDFWNKKDWEGLRKADLLHCSVLEDIMSKHAK